MKIIPKKQLLLSIILLITFNKIFAQFPSNIPYQSISVENPPALPALLETIEDTSVPDAISITRITEYNTALEWYPKHEYAKAQPWNANASVYKFYSNLIYNAYTHEKIRDLPGGSIYPSYWSNTDPDKLYSFRESGYVRVYSVADDNVTDLNTEIQGYDVVKLGPGEGNIDMNDHYVALVGKMDIDMDVIIFDLQENTVIHTELFAGAWGSDDASVPDYIDWVSISQSGDYVGIMWNHNTTSEDNPFNGHYGVEIYNTTDMQFLRRIVSYGNHGDFGFASDGDEVFVQFWGPTGTVNMYYLDRLERVVVTNHNDFNGEGHISCRNLNRPGWAYVSQDEAARSGQIVAMKLDDSGIVEHYGHHFSSSSTYYKSPMPVATPNGDKIMFKSDFGNAANVDEVFVFESVLSNSLDINTVENNINIQVYPNPCSEFVTINSNKIIKTVYIYNSIGQVIKSFDAINSKIPSIPVRDIPQGIYFIKISDGISQHTAPILIK